MAFTIVGDSDQLLYRFAGATPERNLFGIEKVFGGIETHKLTINYRSTEEVVATTSRLIAENYEAAGGPYEERFRKELQARPGAEQGAKVGFRMLASPEQEAQAVVETIVEGIAGGYEPGDFFVGARTRAQLGFLEGPLVRAGLPFVNLTGGSFWASKHVADVVAYVQLAYDVKNSAAFKRVFNIGSNWNKYPWGPNEGEYCSHRYLGDAFLRSCGEQYRYAGNNRRFAAGVNDLVQLVTKLQGVMAEAKDAGKAVSAVLEFCYIKYLTHEDGLDGDDSGASNSKLDDLETVVEIASDFENVGEFLAYIKDCVRAANAAQDKDYDDFVVISTVHRLKGQERKVVLGVGIVEGEDARTGEPRGLLPHTFSLVPPPCFGVLPMGGMNPVEDERCIFFVLVSRAKERVFLFGTETYRSSMMRPSRFLYEAGIIRVGEGEGEGWGYEGRGDYEDRAVA